MMMLDGSCWEELSCKGKKKRGDLVGWVGFGGGGSCSVKRLFVFSGPN